MVQGIGRFRSFDLAGDEPLQNFFRRQQQRIAAKQVPIIKRQDPGGAYTLEIRGTKPAQIALTETPHELLKRDGEAAYKGSVGAFMSGS